MEQQEQELQIDLVTREFVTKAHRVKALEGISLSIKKGEFVCLVGPSGCGKTTLLNLIAGLDFPDQGTISVKGNLVIGPGSDRMMLFQEHALFPWLTVLDNVLFGLKLKNGLKDRKAIALNYLKMMGLEKFAHSSIHELSGGMRQRVALARALAPDPDILLMDEPFAALDAITREQLYFDLQEIWGKQGKTIIFVTHNVAEATCLGDRVIVLSAYPGKIEREFEIDLPRPRDIRDLAVARYAAEITRELRNSSKELQPGGNR
jgi:NitT/TauT family transport system ATP-binding protein